MLRRNEKVDLIKRVPLFADCSRGELEQIAQLADEVDLKEGKELTHLGGPGREFFVLLEGEADVTQDGRSINTLHAGDFFGEIAALTGSPRTANVVSEEFIEIMEVPATTLRALRSLPEMERLIQSKLADRLTRTQNADLVRLAGLDQRDLADLRRRRHEPASSPDSPSPEPTAA